LRIPLILDTGALTALSRRSSAVWKLLDQAQRTGADVLIPAGTLAESIRGGPRDVLVNRLVAQPNTQVTPHDEERARSAGELLARAGTSDAIDALVVAEALRHDSALIATSDPRDIADLADGYRNITAVRV
jgi:predicted nucleic acid-binding protein